MTTPGYPGYYFSLLRSDLGRSAGAIDTLIKLNGFLVSCQEDILVPLL